jgi:hypothetical protein
VSSIPEILRKEGVMGFIVFLACCSIIWMVFLSYSLDYQFVPHLALDDDTMHKTVIYYMLNGEDFYSAWRHAAQATGDLGDLRIYRTPLVFYPIVFLTGWAGTGFVFPLSILCVCVAVLNLILTFWTVRTITGSGWGGLAASIVQYAFFFNVVPLFQISLFAMPFLILAIYWAWIDKPWLAGLFLALAFLIKETFIFAVPAILVFYIIQRKWQSVLFVSAIVIGGIGVYFFHTIIAQPIPDPQMMLNASLPVFFRNLGGFLWFGFGVLHYNVLAPATFDGYYPSNPIPAFVPMSAFYLILLLQIILVWGLMIFWIVNHARKGQWPHLPLLALVILLWIIPVVFAASTHINNFAVYWMDYAIWRWFAPSYVGFQLLVALSWSNVRPQLHQFFVPTLTKRKTQTLKTLQNIFVRDVPFDTQAL